ncbi:hypothetical protein S40285_06802 [Stachybotrys chlorohalonatus IBT 40285]|uniref:Uncharacterized protein n=1 Tax=Stachybotrys chlorohalonatus (strain IBT 40285) TaxID=1283841 RepID=A0A084QIV9_STAC4|nr:hypothetical protein S40285_06802 [Stachybotrys chlorohalonata IBT 40285]
MSSRRRELPIEESWRVVEGENDSFDTSILPSISDDDPLLPHFSGQPSSGLPSQLSSSSQGQGSGDSQDSIRDFSNYQEDDHLILRQPFRPTISSSDLKHRTPDPVFRMPRVESDGSRRTSEASYRTIRPALNDRDQTLRKRNKLFSAGQDSARDQRRDYYDVSHYDDGSQRRGSFGAQLVGAVPSAFQDVIRWAVGILALAFNYAQKPLALLLSIYLCFGALIVVQNMVTKSIYSSLSPICRIPGVSFLNLPICPATPSILQEPQQFEFDDLMSVQSKFEDVLEKSADGVSLPFEMKRSEMSIRDLRTLVRHSDIQAKDELMLEFDGYIDTARRSAADLQKFNAHVGSAVDSVISINRWTSRFIDAMDPESPKASDSSFLSDWSAWLFYPFQPTDQNFNERVLLDKYIDHTALVSDRISTLILEAQAVLRTLTKAEDHLGLIYDITLRSTDTARSRREEIFWTLWTLVGANAGRLHNLSQQLLLLKQVDAHRSTAVAQISALILELEGIQASLGDLRDRVAEPELLRDKTPIPLSVHIDTIDRGIERLEAARTRIRAAEDDRVRDALVKGGLKDERLLEAPEKGA